MITIKSINDLNLLLVKNLHKLTELDIDIIVGIPRSGLMVATIIATHLQKPVTDLYSYIESRMLIESGKTSIIDNNKKIKILLVDDSINTGTSMNEAVNLIKKSKFDHDITKFAVYVSPKTKLADLDLYFECCQHPRAFQWNIWRHSYLKNWATDMDGVLCRDPIWKKENDQGPKLIKFYESAEAKFIPQKPIKYIITSRLEIHRNITENWLRKNNIKYEKLFMKSNSNDFNHAMYKTDIINSLNDLELYIESDMNQAELISKNVKIPVWCIDNQSVYYPK